MIGRAHSPQLAARFRQKLHARIRLWADEEVAMGNVPKRAGTILEAILYRGELPRREVAEAAGVNRVTIFKTLKPETRTSFTTYHSLLAACGIDFATRPIKSRSRSARK